MDSEAAAASRREHVNERPDRAGHFVFGDMPGGAVVGSVIIAGIRAAPSEHLERRPIQMFAMPEPFTTSWATSRIVLFDRQSACTADRRIARRLVGLVAGAT